MYINVAERLIYLREKRGLTTNGLAIKAGISQSHLREIELGTRNPTIDTLNQFCNALHISLSQFFCESDESINPFLLSSIKELSDEQQQKLADFISTLETVPHDEKNANVEINVESPN